jgi:hypothetical protein
VKALGRRLEQLAKRRAAYQDQQGSSWAPSVPEVARFHQASSTALSRGAMRFSKSEIKRSNSGMVVAKSFS